MSRLEELIQELCPDGVEHRKVGDIADVSIGLATSVTKYKRDSGVLLLHNSDIQQGRIELKNIEYIDDSFAKKNSSKLLRKNDIITVHTGDVGTSAVITDEYVGSIGFTTITARIKDFNQVYPYYLCAYFNSHKCKMDIRKMTISDRSNLNQKDFIKIQVPVPPLEVQREIVRILDSFTLLTADLTADLTAELTARKKQYGYYRDELLEALCPDGVEYKTIQEVCVNICSGGTPKTSISEYYGGDIPWVRTQEVDWNYIYDTDVKITEEGLANSSAKWIPANCIIVAMYGATAAKVTINKIPVTTNQACCNLEINENIVLIRYVYHFLCNEYENLKGMGQGSQSNINAQMIKNYKLPVPPLEVQREIVRILDSFTELTAELTAELTTELTARQKQYEFYRDKLLSFKQL